MAKGWTRDPGSPPEAKHQWGERRFWTDHAPEGKCWTLREMFSYITEIEDFTAHLLAMAEGLERAYFTQTDLDADGEDSYGIFVCGLRPMTDADKTYDDMDRERKEQDERAMLAHLKEKYEIGPDQEKLEV